MEIMKYELEMWEAAKNRDREAFLKLVSGDAIMICGGLRCLGVEYAGFIGDFDLAQYEIKNFEVILQTNEICQVHYVVITTVANEQASDLAGTFHVTSTWKKESYGWQLVFNMDSRL